MLTKEQTRRMQKTEMRCLWAAAYNRITDNELNEEMFCGCFAKLSVSRLHGYDGRMIHELGSMWR
jgi:hypothetical protein